MKKPVPKQSGYDESDRRQTRQKVIRCQRACFKYENHLKACCHCTMESECKDNLTISKMHASTFNLKSHFYDRCMQNLELSHLGNGFKNNRII